MTKIKAIEKKEQVQVVRCKKCNQIFAGCRLDSVEIDEDWKADLKKWQKAEHIIDVVDKKDAVLGGCNCYTKEIRNLKALMWKALETKEREYGLTDNEADIFYLITKDSDIQEILKGEL